MKKTRSKSIPNYDDLDSQLEITENLLYEIESLITEVMYDLDDKMNLNSNNTPPIEIPSRLRFLSAQFGGLSEQIDENLDNLEL